MGAAIPVALTLALAIPDHLPCGPAGVEQTVQTGSTDCWDEILPLGEDGEEDVRLAFFLPVRAISLIAALYRCEQEEKDPAYQTRVKSTVAVRLALKNTSGDSGKK